MKNKNINRGTVKKVLVLTHRIVPGYIIFLLTTKMMAAAQPFIGIYCTSLILDGLIHLDRFEAIFKTVLIMIALDSLLVLIRWRLEGINWVKRHELTQKINKMLSIKTMEIDFDILEKHETLDLVKKAKEGANSYGDIGAFCNNLADIIEKLATIVYSVALLVPLFIPKGLQTSESLSGLSWFLNQWYSLFIMLAVLAFHVLISYKTNKKSSLLQKQFFEKNVSYNRYFGYWFDLIYLIIINRWRC